MSRCLLVISIPRAGSSCVAGVLHRLGVDMGDGHFQSKDKFNSRGYYEDLQWRYANQRITGKGYSLQAATVQKVGKRQRAVWRKLARQYKVKSLWGIKDPWLCFVGQFIWPILCNQGVDVRVVFVHRPREASTASIAKHLRQSYKGRYKQSAEQIEKAWYKAFVDRRAEFEGRAMDVQYETLVAGPMPQVLKLAAFAHAGGWQTSDLRSSDIDEAAGWVTPKLKHF